MIAIYFYMVATACLLAIIADALLRIEKLLERILRRLY